ncbi:hypothetical protein BC941DRAFT_445702 [Chlamydoabsidia padenii]|nr:hypothetical protein BC941DRAFT_445702 [Chlamydoabsidia padenii]
MLILRHNNLSAEELFQIERKLLKAQSNYPTQKVEEHQQQQPGSLDFTLYDKSRADIYGIILACFRKLDLLDKLGWTPSVLLDFLIDVDQGYHPNAYHSFYHGVDVMLVLYHMVQEYDIVYYLSPIDIVILFIAGLCHDIGHPGLNNNYQVNMKTNLANQYNNHSVLESYSCSLTLDLVKKHHLFSSIESYSRQQGDTITEREAKLSLVKMILATDMIFHYELQENMAAILDIFQPTCTSNEEHCLSEHKHEESSLVANCSSNSNATAETRGQFKEEGGIVTFVTPRLRDIFANLGENSPLLYFLDQYDLRPPDRSSSMTNQLTASPLPAPVTMDAQLPPSAYLPTPFPTLSSSSTTSTSSTKATKPQSPSLPEKPDMMIAAIDNTGGICLHRNHRLILCQSLLHAADISNPLRPWPVCYMWSQRVCTEFFHQGDMERSNGLPPSPNMDRRKTDQLTVGLKFSDYVVSPYFEIFAALFPKADALLALLKANRLRWLETIQEEKVKISRKSIQQQSPSQINESHFDSMLNDQSFQQQQDADIQDEDDDDFVDHSRIPDPLVPVGVINPSGRRVSVAAGMAVIPDDLERRTIGAGPRRRVYWGIRSASYADALHQAKSHQLRQAHNAHRSTSLGGDHLIKSRGQGSRRNSEQPSSPSLH